VALGDDKRVDFLFVYLHYYNIFDAMTTPMKIDSVDKITFNFNVLKRRDQHISEVLFMAIF